MVVYLDAMIRAEKIKGLSFSLPGGKSQNIVPHDETSPPTIDRLPLPVLFATRFILNPKLKGLEVDLYVQTEADGYTPVTAIQELDGRVRIQMGRRARRCYRKAERRRRRRCRRVLHRGGDRRRSRVAADRTLRAGASAGPGSPAELATLSSLPFMRKQRAERATKSLPPTRSGAFTKASAGDDQPRRIFLYDTKEKHENSLFIGDPGRPIPS